MRHLVIMAKAPRFGRVKTRLGADVGMARATRFYRSSLSQICTRLWAPRKWRLVLAIADESDTLRSFAGVAPPSALGILYQGRGGLGARLETVFRQLHPQPTVVIGSDVPALTQGDLDRAFACLMSHDAVVGPSSDGGYWMIGARGRAWPPHALAGVRWSTEHALADTVGRLAGLRVGFAHALDDVDDAAGLVRAGRSEGRFVLPAER
ncbi:MAG: TIGR04282 family arsenosugar biosynthesis glycosyltransferase [Pseudomonadota bacterium]